MEDSSSSSISTSSTPTSPRWAYFVAIGELPPREESVFSEVDADAFTFSFLNITSARIRSNPTESSIPWLSVDDDVRQAIQGRKPIGQRTESGVLFRIYISESSQAADSMRHVFVVARIINLEKKLGLIVSADRIL